MSLHFDPPAVVDSREIAAANAELEGASPEAVLRFAAARFPGRIAFATAFGPEGCVLVDVIAHEGLPIDVFTLDTGLLFPETIELWEALERRYGIVIRAVRPAQSVSEQAAQYGRALWESLPDRCCELRKVEPLRNELSRLDAWISSIRRDQTRDRAAARTVERDTKFGLIKINPLVSWSSEAVWERIRERRIPVNALHAEGYPSIGCEPCTTAVAHGEDPRAGRWRTFEKKECGLHARFPNGQTPTFHKES
ncbi:MAG: phosphoadenylyl-sulfate reductase [Myxococcales bacterium]